MTFVLYLTVIAFAGPTLDVAVPLDTMARCETLRTQAVERANSVKQSLPKGSRVIVECRKVPGA
jgi:hypothetical protein